MPRLRISIAVTVAALCLAVYCGSATGANRWIASWDAEKGSDNLTVASTVSDGIPDYVEVAGRKAVTTKQTYIYLQVADSFLFGADMDMTLVIDYFDSAPGWMCLEYDGMNDAGRQSYTPTRSVSLTGSKTWKQVALKMPRAYLGNAVNIVADMRLPFVVEGAAPAFSRFQLSVDGLEDKTFDSADQMQQARRDLKLKRAVDQARQFESRRTRIDDALDKLRSTVSAETMAALQPIPDAAQSAFDSLVAAISSSPIFTDENALDSFIESLRAPCRMVDNCARLLESRVKTATFVSDWGRQRTDWLYFVRPATTTLDLVLPSTLPAPSEVQAPINLRMCRGEFEPCTIGILAKRAVPKVSVILSDLRSPEGAVIPADRIDVRTVKCWYQNGRLYMFQTGKQLVPELLLHDDSLVGVDLIKQENTLHFQDETNDPQSLVPFDLEPLFTKQLWLTIHAPEKARTGVYRGTVRVSADGIRSLVVPVTVEILPFDLKGNPKIASMYQCSNWDPSKHGGRILEKNRSILADMRDHGLTDPTYEPPVSGHEIDMQKARADLALRKELGLNKGPLLVLGGYSVPSYLADSSPEDEKKAKLRGTIDALNTLAKEFGYDGAYIYGIDEASGATLASEIPVFKLVESMGGGVWVAVLSDFADVALRDVQLPNYSGLPKQEVIDAVHAAGHRIMAYAWPWGGIEDPWQFRYCDGLRMWETDLDGRCTWAFWGPVGSPWDDTDPQGSGRDFMMVYPDAHGCISTVQWEGYREGCDDLRYMATLEAALARAKKDKRNLEVAADVEKWFAAKRALRFEPDNLDSVRERMIRFIIALQN